MWAVEDFTVSALEDEVGAWGRTRMRRASRLERTEAPADESHPTVGRYPLTSRIFLWKLRN